MWKLRAALGELRGRNVTQKRFNTEIASED